MRYVTRKTISIFLLSGLCVAGISCGKFKKKLASERLSLASEFCQKGDSTGALLQLDSIKILYPEEFQVLTEAEILGKKINSEIMYRKQDQLDTMLARIERLEKKFDVEKTEFDRFAQYIHKRQNSERRWNKSYIQFHLDERGDLYMSSNYYGKEWLDHTGIRVYDGEIQAKTEEIPVGDVNNHHSDFMETHWEKVSYRDGKDNGVIRFIAEHADRNLKAVYLGKRLYFIILEDYDKQAAKDALALSEALKNKTRLEKEIKALQSKI